MGEAKAEEDEGGTGEGGGGEGGGSKVRRRRWKKGKVEEARWGR